MKYKQPGGSEHLIENAGKDITQLFKLLHQPQIRSEALNSLTLVGQLDSNSIQSETITQPNLAEQLESNRQNLPNPNVIVKLTEFETLAKQVLGASTAAWYFISSFADDGKCKL